MEKKKLKKLKINKMSEFSVISEKEQTQLKGGGYWDPELGYVTDEVTVYGTDQSTFWKRLKYRASFFNNCAECREANEMLNDMGHPITDYKEGGTGAGVETLFEHFIYGWHDEHGQ